MEEWKKIKDTNYSISDCGRVRNDDTNHILSARKHTVGYSSVCLGRGKQTLIHRLVAEAFIGENPKDGMVVDHINRIKTDNRVCNLRWATKKQNAQNTDNTHITYVVNITRQDKRFRKSFKTLEEAEVYRNYILESYPIF